MFELKGCFIKRHKIPGANGEPLTPADISVGASVCVYGRNIRITDADPFTRGHMSSRGITLAAAESYATDPFHAKLEAAAAGRALGKNRAIVASKDARFLSILVLR